jgi:hypothetical protein
VGTCKHCIIREGKEVQKEQREFYIDNLPEGFIAISLDE